MKRTMRVLWRCAATALLLILLLVCLREHCGEKNSPIVGVWSCDDVGEAMGALIGMGADVMGMGYIGKLTDGLKIGIDMTFREDGTYQIEAAMNMYFLGSQLHSESGTYVWENGMLIADGQPVDIEIKGKKLIYREKTQEDYDICLEFVRQE